MARRSTDSALSDQEQSVLRRLESTGWFVNVIFGDDKEPGFAYSFGLYQTFGHPEIILFGLPLDQMHGLINTMGKAISNGARYSEDEKAYDLLIDQACIFRRVDAGWYSRTLTWTAWFYRSNNFPALQLFWPDEHGCFPQDENCMAWVRECQPDLSKRLPASA